MEQNGLDHDSRSSIDTTINDTQKTFLEFRSYTQLSEKLASSSSYTAPSPNEDGPKGVASAVSQGSESVVSWTTLTHVYSILGAYGGPTCLYPTATYFLMGTSKGCVLIFNYNEHLQTILVPTLSEDPSIHSIRSPVKSIVICSDGTHVAASYETGNICIWNLNVGYRVKPTSEPTNGMTPTPALPAVLHIDDHVNKEITGLDFFGARHTALIVSDRTGKVSLYNGYRRGFWQLVYNSKKILDVNSSKEKLIRSKLSPLISREKISTNLLSVLTTTHFALILLSPHVSLMFQETVEPSVQNSLVVNSSISWTQNCSRVAYSVNNKISVISISSSDFNVQSASHSPEFAESILSIQWIDQLLLGVLTISHQFLVLDPQHDFKILLRLDFLIHDLMIPPNKYFVISRRSFYLLTNYSFKIGKFVSWSDITLRHILKGDYLGALEFIESLLQPYCPLANLLKLDNNTEERTKQLMEPFYNLSLAALRFLIKKDNADYNRVYQLLMVVVRVLQQSSKKLDSIPSLDVFLEQGLEFFELKDNAVYFEVVANIVAQGSVTSISPVLFRSIIDYYAKEENLKVIEDLIIMLNPTTLDVDLAVKLCQKYNLFDLLIYIWNKIFDDYQTPVVDLIYRISNQSEKCVIFNGPQVPPETTIFDYVTYILTGRQYPQNLSISPSDKCSKIQRELSAFIFSGFSIKWPSNSNHKLYICENPEEEPAFPYFHLLLKSNPSRFLAMLNEVFEASLFNDDNDMVASVGEAELVSRQYVIDLLLDAMKDTGNSDNIRVLVAIFIATSISKYPQFIKVSNQALDCVVNTICSSRVQGIYEISQIALESLLPYYHSRTTENFILELKEKNFNKVLFHIYKSENKYASALSLILETKDIEKEYNTDIVSITDYILKKCPPGSLECGKVTEVIETNFDLLLSRIGIEKCVTIFSDFDYNLHQEILEVKNEETQQKYLDKLFSTPNINNKVDKRLRNLHIELNCKYKSKREMILWLNGTVLSNAESLQILDLLNQDSNFEAAAIIHERLESFNLAVRDLLSFIEQCLNEGKTNISTLLESLRRAFDDCNSAGTEKKSCWILLITFLITLYGKYPSHDERKDLCNKLLQEAFLGLVRSKSSSQKDSGGEFWEIMSSVLEHQDVILMKVQDLKQLLLNVFNTYKLERSLSELIQKIIEDSSQDLVQQYRKFLSEGWSIHTDDCEICGKKIWGAGLDPLLFLAWENVQRHQDMISVDLKTPLVIFKCHHGFHQTCLENLAQKPDEYSCLICQTESNPKIV
ncbi:CBM_HP2_G0000520.mRNA.1.CDS.1 [Saccharomyces cerevisiae]|nr:CBM_HP2_G0000520.mRNA.1.CDS.1 [Saccharomyces cerevisiae]CAI6446498.1 CBM_HP2_G0000520.mRNA.1.CDS.1 [Saccharomyces cerevisiae]